MKNGGVVVAFSQRTVNHIPTDRVVRFSANGGAIWSFGRVGDTMIAADTDPAGNLYLLFDGPSEDEIVNLDISGAMRWSYVLESPPHIWSYEVRSLDVTDQGDVFVAGMGFTGASWPRMILHRFDASGGLTWEWNAAGLSTFSVPYGDPTRVVVGEGDSIFVIGHCANIQYRFF